jgi:peptide deformylase
VIDPPSPFDLAAGSGVAGSGVVREVLRAPSAILSQPAADVDPAAADVAIVVADLISTMRVSPGCVGLAAPQIGVPLNVFVVDVSTHPKTRTSHGLIALCNARVVTGSQWRAGREGCLSVPDLTGDVRRAGHITVAGQTPVAGDPVEMTTDAFEARALQHEIDHCAGLLFLDRVAGAHALHARQVYL